MAREARRHVVDGRLSVVQRPQPVALSPTTDYRPPTTAFTLIEMLVALALVSTIMMMVYGSHAAASRCLDRYGSRMASSERASLVLRLMARQIRCAYAPTAPSTPAQPTSLTPAPAAPTLFRADGTSLSFITTGGPDRSAAFSRVQYRYDSFSGILSFGCQPYTYGAEIQSHSGYEQPVPGLPSGVTILRSLRRMDLQFYDGRQWRPTWEGADSAGLPRAVKIVLILIDKKNCLHEYGTTVPIVCQKPASTRQSAVGVAQL